MDNPLTDTLQALEGVAKKNNVTILLSLEAGSRAWGLNSLQSDYDVKFIYVRPLEWYLSIEDGRRDVIEDNSKRDMNGWDIRKALQLLRESNCSVLEWIHSEHIYTSNETFLKDIKDLSNQTHSRKALAMAWLSKARKHFEEYLIPVEGRVQLKKYIFVIQCILNTSWLLSYSPEGIEFPPQNFDTLLESIQKTSYKLPDEVLTITNELVAKKRAGTLNQGKRIPVIDKWVDQAMPALTDAAKKMQSKKHTPADSFDELFCKTVLSCSKSKFEPSIN